MSQKSGTPKMSSERIVKDIRRATRKQYSAEEKIRHHGANTPSAGLTSDQPDDNNPLDRFEIEDGTWRKATWCRRWSTSGPRLPA